MKLIYTGGTNICRWNSTTAAISLSMIIKHHCPYLNLGLDSICFHAISVNIANSAIH